MLGVASAGRRLPTWGPEGASPSTSTTTQCGAGRWQISVRGATLLGLCYGPPVMKDTPKSQPDKFRDLARELEANEDEKAFEDRVRRIATAPPAKNEPPKA